MPYSYDRSVGILYMHDHVDMTTHGTAFDEPVGVRDRNLLMPAVCTDSWTL